MIYHVSIISFVYTFVFCCPPTINWFVHYQHRRLNVCTATDVVSHQRGSYRRHKNCNKYLSSTLNEPKRRTYRAIIIKRARRANEKMRLAREISTIFTGAIISRVASFPSSWKKLKLETILLNNSFLECSRSMNSDLSDRQLSHYFLHQNWLR